MTLKTQPQKIKLDLFNTSGITITEFTSEDSEKIYQLTWTDYVIGEWYEYYDNIATALARVAVLAHCLQDENSSFGFKRGNEQFASNAIRFLDSEVQ